MTLYQRLFCVVLLLLILLLFLNERQPSDLEFKSLIQTWVIGTTPQLLCTAGVLQVSFQLTVNPAPFAFVPPEDSKIEADPLRVV